MTTKGSNSNMPPPDINKKRKSFVQKKLNASLRDLSNCVISKTRTTKNTRYSIERLQSFEDYRKASSPLWIFFVILLTPLPSVLVLSALNFIELAEITAGWKANYMFFIRAFVALFFNALAFRFQREHYLPTLQVSNARNALVAIFMPTMYVSAMLAISILTIFPLPFLMLVPAVIVLPVVVAFLNIFIRTKKSLKGQRQVHQDPSVPGNNEIISQLTEAQAEQKTALKRYKKIFVFEHSLIFIYPFVAVGFKVLQREPGWQTAFALLLPILKFILTRFTKKLFAHVEDLAAESTVFTVAFFNALFASMCMSNGSSITASIFIMALDFGQIIFSMIKFAKKSKELVQRIQLNKATTGSTDVVAECLCLAHTYFLQLIDHPNIRWKTPQGISFKRSSFAEKLDQAARRLSNEMSCILRRSSKVSQDHDVLEAQGQAQREGLSGAIDQTSDVVSSLASHHPIGHKSHTEIVKKHSLRMGLTYPLTDNESCLSVGTSTLNTTIPATTTLDENTERDIKILDEALHLLYRMEYIVLMEYVEAFIPYVYALYITLSWHSPCKKFIYGLDTMDSDQLDRSMANMLSYGALEFISLVLLFILVNFRFRINILYLLAFVLETHWYSIQGKLFLFFVLVLHVNLHHFGMDFSFQFVWLRNSTITAGWHVDDL